MIWNLPPVVAELKRYSLWRCGVAYHRLGAFERWRGGRSEFSRQHQYQQQLQTTRRGLLRHCGTTALNRRAAPALSPSSLYSHFARLNEVIWCWCGATVAGIHASAVIDPGRRADPTASIGPLCGGSAVHALAAHTAPSPGLRWRVCHIGAHCPLLARLLVPDGFGFAPNGPTWRKSEQLGPALGDHVEIGANTCIDRGARHGH